MTTTTQARTARIAHRCVGCRRRAIAPGHRYLRHVMFPGDINTSGKPWTSIECVACLSEREYAGPLLIAGACASFCHGEHPCAWPFGHVGDHQCVGCFDTPAPDLLTTVPCRPLPRRAHPPPPTNHRAPARRQHPRLTGRTAMTTDPTDQISTAMDELGLGGQATRPYADRVPAPRPVPTTRQRLTDARGCDHTPEQHRHDDGQDADAASRDRAIRELTAERDGLRDDIQRVEQTRQEQVTELRGRLAAMTEAATDHRKTAGRALSDRDRYARTAANLLAQRNEAAAQAEVATDDALRLAAELDTAQQVATFRQGVIDLHAAELGAAGEVIAVVRDAQEQIERALARYDTAPEVTPVEPEHVHDDIECGCELTPADAPLGSVSPHAQDDRNALVYNAVSRALLDCDPWAPLATLRERCTAAVLAALADQPAALPTWVLDLVRGLDRYELEHPKLLNANTNTEWPCPAPLLALVPAEVRRQAEVGDREPRESEQVLRDRIEHAIRARTGEKFPGCRDDFLDRVAAVAAVAAVNELRQG